MTWNEWTIVFFGLFLLHHGFEQVLDMLQAKHLGKKRKKVPEHLEGKIDLKTIQKAADYNLAKIRLGMVNRLNGTLAICILVAFGFGWVDGFLGFFEFSPLITGLLFFAVFGVLSFAWDLPLEIVSVFGIEAMYGFNKQTPLSFALDKLKEALVSAVMGGVVLSLVLLLMEEGGDLWWLYAFAAVLGIQLLIAWIYPVAIMPLFNKFTPVTGELADDVEKMAREVKFKLTGVMSMDGSKRSTHSNAFFIGLFGAKRVVLYDTLMERVGRSELIAVLAHEFGHFKLKHLTKRLALMSISLLVLFFALSYLRDLNSVYTGLGFAGQSSHAALIVFALLVSEILAPAAWLSKILSRRDERAADRFAVDAVGNGTDLKEALISLTKQNLGSPGSHKLYRAYHNSHPTLKSRLKSIDEYAKTLS